jgi:hypothetical protein
MMTYGGGEHEEDESIGGGLCPPGQELNWFMIMVVLLLMYFLYCKYTRERFTAPEDNMEYFVPEELVYGDRNQ